MEASAFTIAFQVPNLLRSLVADAALSAAFVPVFTELLEQNRKREAYHLAGALFGLILTVLGAITAVFFLAAPVIMPLFTGDTFSPADDDADGRAEPGDVPDRGAARAQRPRRRGSSTPTTTSRSRRSRRWCGTW